MKIEQITPSLSVSDQIQLSDLTALAECEIEILVCNRPDGEASNQPSFRQIAEEAMRLGIEPKRIAFAPNQATDAQIAEMSEILATDKKVHAYCRSGSRSKVLCKKAQKVDLSSTSANATAKYDVVIVGAGSGGIAAASGLRKRNKALRIAVIEPSEEHYYQPGWTLVGGGIFQPEYTRRRSKEVIPAGVDWIRVRVIGFAPSTHSVLNDDGTSIMYKHLIVAPGLKLNWAAIEGLEETLGKNGVTSNYRYDLAPYTWKLVTGLKKGNAIFTQPPMPIKCAGAPQKAMYLSSDQWLKSGVLKDIDVQFFNPGAAIFGVSDYVPALMSYVEKYDIDLRFGHNLIKVDGDSQTAWFKKVNTKGEEEVIETKFDFLHVCPPQCAPDFIYDSELSDDTGWLEVDPGTLQHKRFSNIWGVGDVLNTPNAKTAAAARKQAPVVAQNVANVITGKSSTAIYDGYGSCPLTVERGKVVLAEFKYGGTLSPTFPKWLNNSTKATAFGWALKAWFMPWVYWHLMLKGREWLASPQTQGSQDR